VSYILNLAKENGKEYELNIVGTKKQLTGASTNGY